MTKRKPKKPYTVEWRAKDGQLFRDWSVYSRYKTEKDRDKGLRALALCGHRLFEFRAGPCVHDGSQTVANKKSPRN